MPSPHLRLHCLSSLRCHVNSAPKSKLPTLPKIPSKYRSLAIRQAQKALADYLHTTRALPFAYADYISKNSHYSLSGIISKVHFSAPTFSRSVQKFLMYNPINEFEFFYESIGIGYREIDGFLKPNLFFFSEDSSPLNAACALAGFGFPWNKLGRLCKGEVSIFGKTPEFLADRINGLKAAGFSNFPVIGICLAFPFVLSGGSELSGEINRLLDDLKRVLIEFDLEGSIEGNAEAWYEVCGKIRVFYDLGVEKGEIGELMGRNRHIFLEHRKEVLVEKIEFFCRLGVSKEEVCLLLLETPEILRIDLKNPTISVLGFLKHFGMQEKMLKLIAQKYSYVLGMNKMANLPYILRAMNLHEWAFDEIKKGGYQLLANYSLSSPDESTHETYLESLEKIRCTKTPYHTISKLNFLHGIGFGENSFTIKLLANVHGTSSVLQERFDCLLHAGIEFSKLCKMISLSPKILNQDANILRRKLNFLQEIGSSLQYLDVFPAYLLYDLERRIKPRYKFHVWLTEKGLCMKSYSIASMIATSEKSFLARLAGIHPTALTQWLEHFAYKNQNRDSRE
ncbi:hypothetical protein Nepgr_023492 [Nepenthes gracilis]|uniref:Transcription termination factor MTEF18, mitochondrial n=1 Tax=Nepenthes gracilis TaxID=150966 RepID=A0AAD3T1B7_NEPGR|nr:hypothetical protein Nepgr_023492 [Nepenthes gracilis]